MRKLIALLSVALVVALGACDPQAGSQPERRPTPGNHQPPQPPQGAQQPAPAGDPGQHNTQPGEVDLHVTWTSENKHTPVCVWAPPSAIGQPHPCEGLQEGTQVDGKGDYYGLWEREEHGQAGDTFQLNAHGWPGTKSIECAYFWKGKYHALYVKGTQCGGTFVLD